MENHIWSQDKIFFEMSPLLIIALVDFGYELWLDDNKGLAVLPLVSENFCEADFGDDSPFLISDD